MKMKKRIEKMVKKLYGETLIDLYKNEKKKRYDDWDYMAVCKDSTYKVYIDEDNSIQLRWV